MKKRKTRSGGDSSMTEIKIELPSLDKTLSGIADQLLSNIKLNSIVQPDDPIETDDPSYIELEGIQECTDAYSYRLVGSRFIPLFRIGWSKSMSNMILSTQYYGHGDQYYYTGNEINIGNRFKTPCGKTYVCSVKTNVRIILSLEKGDNQ